MMDLARELMPRALAVALSFSRGAGFVAVSPFPGGQAGPKARVGLAVMLAGQGSLREATQTARAALAVSQRVLGPDHPETARIALATRNIEAASRTRAA